MEEKRPGLLYRITERLVIAFSKKYRLEGADNLPEGPCFIAANHCQMYGPLASEFYIPGDHYTWCASEMMDIKEVPAYAYKDFWSMKPGYIRWFYRILSYVIAPLSVFIFCNAHTVPVYRDHRIITTVKKTVDLLLKGCRITVFPEYGKKHNSIINDFQDRFIDTARSYIRKSGRTISFVPAYISPALGLIVFGAPTEYDADSDLKKERERITAYLMESITEMAVSLPRHRVVPYLNLPKKDRPYNR